MKKITTKTIKDSIKEIGFKGTLIRGSGFISLKFTENELLYKYVLKRYKKYMLNQMLYNVKKELSSENIWVCWFQGIDNAPEIVKKCFESLCKYNSDKHIVVITDNNYFKYVELPEHIKKKYQEGKITKTHFSDILRAALLYQNGGLWVDSTMLFTDSIPRTIWSEEIFAFKIYNRETRQVASSQFLYAKKGNEILGRTLIGLYKYWEKKDKLITYYLFHYFFAIAVECNDYVLDQWKKTSVFYSELNHILQRELFSQYSKDKWEYIKKVSFVHKLSYKHITPERESFENTFYKYIIGKLKYE